MAAKSAKFSVDGYSGSKAIPKKRHGSFRPRRWRVEILEEL